MKNIKHPLVVLSSGAYRSVGGISYKKSAPTEGILRCENFWQESALVSEADGDGDGSRHACLRKYPIILSNGKKSCASILEHWEAMTLRVDKVPGGAISPLRVTTSEQCEEMEKLPFVLISPEEGGGVATPLTAAFSKEGLKSFVDNLHTEVGGKDGLASVIIGGSKSCKDVRGEFDKKTLLRTLCTKYVALIDTSSSRYEAMVESAVSEAISKMSIGDKAKLELKRAIVATFKDIADLLVFTMVQTPVSSGVGKEYVFHAEATPILTVSPMMVLPWMCTMCDGETFRSWPDKVARSPIIPRIMSMIAAEFGRKTSEQVSFLPMVMCRKLASSGMKLKLSDVFEGYWLPTSSKLYKSKKKKVASAEAPDGASSSSSKKKPRFSYRIFSLSYQRMKLICAYLSGGGEGDGAPPLPSNDEKWNRVSYRRITNTLNPSRSFVNENWKQLVHGEHDETMQLRVAEHRTLAVIFLSDFLFNWFITATKANGATSLLQREKAHSSRNGSSDAPEQRKRARGDEGPGYDQESGVETAGGIYSVGFGDHDNHSGETSSSQGKVQRHAAKRQRSHGAVAASDLVPTGTPIFELIENRFKQISQSLRELSAKVDSLQDSKQGDITTVIQSTVEQLRQQQREDIDRLLSDVSSVMPECEDDVTKVSELRAIGADSEEEEAPGARKQHASRKRKKTSSSHHRRKGKSKKSRGRRRSKKSSKAASRKRAESGEDEEIAGELCSDDEDFKIGEIEIASSGEDDDGTVKIFSSDDDEPEYKPVPSSKRSAEISQEEYEKIVEKGYLLEGEPSDASDAEDGVQTGAEDDGDDGSSSGIDVFSDPEDEISVVPLDRAQLKHVTHDAALSTEKFKVAGATIITRADIYAYEVNEKIKGAAPGRSISYEDEEEYVPPRSKASSSDSAGADAKRRCVVTLSREKKRAIARYGATCVSGPDMCFDRHRNKGAPPRISFTGRMGLVLYPNEEQTKDLETAKQFVELMESVLCADTRKKFSSVVSDVFKRKIVTRSAMYNIPSEICLCRACVATKDMSEKQFRNAYREYEDPETSIDAEEIEAFRTCMLAMVRVCPRPIAKGTFKMRSHGWCAYCGNIFYLGCPRGDEVEYIRVSPQEDAIDPVVRKNTVGKCLPNPVYYRVPSAGAEDDQVFCPHTDCRAEFSEKLAEIKRLVSGEGAELSDDEKDEATQASDDGDDGDDGDDDDDDDDISDSSGEEYNSQ